MYIKRSQLPLWPVIEISITIFFSWKKRKNLLICVKNKPCTIGIGRRTDVVSVSMHISSGGNDARDWLFHLTVLTPVSRTSQGGRGEGARVPSLTVRVALPAAARPAVLVLSEPSRAAARRHHTPCHQSTLRHKEERVKVLIHRLVVGLRYALTKRSQITKL